MKKPLPTIPGRRAALATLSRTDRNFARQWGDVPALTTVTAKARFSLPRLNVEKLALAFLLSVACASGAAVAVMQAPAFNLKGEQLPGLVVGPRGALRKITREAYAASGTDLRGIIVLPALEVVE